VNGHELKELREKLGLTQAQLHEKSGVPQSTISRLEKDGDIIKKVETLNALEMALLSNQHNPRIEAKPLRLADPYGLDATNEKIYKLPDDSLIMQVPIIPYKAWGSYLRGHSDPEFYDGLQTMPVPVDSAHKGTYLIFEVGGESMVNPGSRKSIWPGEKIIGRDLRREHWKYKLHINSTDAWIIVHKERGIVIKEIIAHDVDSGNITLHSWNPDKTQHADYVVSLDDIEQIFNVVDPFNRFG
jgi:transcriptional regulator with XRE-family HTH domain